MNVRKTRKGITRRDFLRSTAGITLAGTVGASASAAEAQEEAAAKKKSKVILVRDADALDANGSVNAEVIQRMLDDAVTALVGESDPVAAWKLLVKPTDTVGIKSNVWDSLPTPPELEAAIKRRVMDAGVAEDRIDVADRGILENPIFQNATALINARPMRTHHWAGVGSLLKNYIQFVPNPSAWHGDSCADLAAIWQLPMVKGKTRLNVLVMLTPLFHSKGPHNFQQEHTWAYMGLLVGSDPVAVDATGLRIIEAKRLAYFGEEQPFPIPPKHIRVAEEKYALGVADPSRIDVQKLGWTNGILI